MVCPNCQNETNGLKLNNRLFCTECGFVLSEPETVTPPAPEPKPEPEETKTIVFHDPTEKESKNEPGPVAAPKIIEDEEEEFSLAPLEAEEAVLDLVEKEAAKLEAQAKKKPTEVGAKPIPELEISDKSIKKHERRRTDQKSAPTVSKPAEETKATTPKKGRYEFPLIPGEPDPITEPELTAPEEEPDAPKPPIEEPAVLATKSTETEQKAEPTEEPENEEKAEEESPTKPIEEVVEEVRQKAFKSAEPKAMISLDIDKEKKEVKEILEEEEKEKAKHNHQNELLSYFRQIGGLEKTPAKKKKKPKKNHKWLYISLGVISGILLIIVGAVLYVNLYAKKPQTVQRTAESAVEFNYLRPTYLPPGYELSYRTSASAKQIKYVYEYLPDKAKNLTVSIAPTTLKESDIKTELVDPTGKNFTNTTENGINAWIVGDTTLYFIKSDVLYTIESNAVISSEDLMKIAVGMQ